MMDIRAELRNFVRKNYPACEGGFDDNTPLIEKGVVDSFGFLELLTFIKSRFAVTVEDAALQDENSDTIDYLARYIEKSTPRGVKS
jgi:acyl carrier protein